MMIARAILLSTVWLCCLSAQTWTKVTPHPSGGPASSFWRYDVYDPVSGTVVLMHHTTGLSIYSNGTWHFNLATNTFSFIAGSGSTSQTCPANTASYPGDRHPVGLQAYDSIRRVMWFHGGVCQGNVKTDLYRYNLNANPASNTWTQLSDPPANPADSRYNNTVHVPTVDALVTFGYDGGAASRNTYIYCFADRNPTPGTLTAAQTTAGCSQANRWVEVIETVSGTNPFGAGHWMHWNSMINRIVLFDSSTTSTLEVYDYNVANKTWTQRNPAGKPPRAQSSSPIFDYPAVAYISKTGKYLYHYTAGTTPADYEYDPVANTWTNLGNRGGQADLMSIVYDPKNNKVFGFGSDDGGDTTTPEIWTLSLTSESTVGGTVSIRNRTNADVVNYPLQIGRAFKQGDVANYPGLVFCADSTCDTWDLIQTQADVKSRYTDNSVKYAVISAIIPVLPFDRTLNFKFVNQTSGNNNGFLTISDMTSQFDFDAAIETSQGNRSARTILQAHSGAIPDCETLNWNTATTNKACYWLKGPINTTVIIGDNTTARAYDIGSSNLRPFFHASFWPLTSSVRVRYVLENSYSEGTADTSYSLTLKSGFASPATRYTKASVPHHALSRWTKVFWIGTTPTDTVDIAYDLAYLAESKAVANYNTAFSINSSKITSEYSSWTSAAKDLFDGGLWTKAMGSGGGRQDIGPMPGWHTRWLYSGDYRLREIALGQTDLASAWPAVIREGDPAKQISSGVNGLGRPVSIYGRPTTSYLSGYDYSYTASADRIDITLPTNTNGWNMEESHTPNPWYVSYLLTGDYYYLEGGLFWVFWTAHCANGAATTQSYGRGPTGREGVIDNGQMRGIAWTLRSRAEFGWLTPSAMPEYTALQQWMGDAIAADEGARNITGTGYYNNAVWTFGRTYRSTGSQETLSGQYPPLGQWRRGSSSFAQAEYGINPSAVSEAISLFEASFLTYALGRAKELGYATDALLSYVAPMWTGIVPTYKYILNSGRVPTIFSGAYFTTWSSAWNGYYATLSACTSGGGCPFSGSYHVRDQSAFWKSGAGSGNPSFDIMATAAISMIAGEPGGSTAWNTLVSDGMTNISEFADDPSWAILPRSASTSNPSNKGVTGRVTITGRGTMK